MCAGSIAKIVTTMKQAIANRLRFGVLAALSAGALTSTTRAADGIALR